MNEYKSYGPSFFITEQLSDFAEYEYIIHLICSILVLKTLHKISCFLPFISTLYSKILTGNPGEPVRPSAPMIPGGPGGPFSSGAVCSKARIVLELHPH